MKIYLVRHGETKEGAEGIILGSRGGNLNENGLHYSQNIANYFKERNIPIFKIITSNLNRAVETAEIIASKLHVPIEIENLVRERGAGIVEGKKDSDIDWQTYELAALQDRKHPGGESFQEVKNRAQQFLINLKKQNQQDLVVVSHSVFILMLVSLIQGTTVEQALNTKNSGQILALDLDNQNLESLF